MPESLRPFPDPEQFCFVRIPVKALDVVYSALEAGGFSDVAASARILSSQHTDPAAHADAKKFLDLAGSRVDWGELEIDSDAVVSFSDDPGAYVMSWVWIYKPQCRECNERHFPDETCIGPARDDPEAAQPETIPE